MGKIKSTVRKVGIRALIFLLYLFVGAGIFLGIEKTDDYSKSKNRWERSQESLKKTYNINDTDMEEFIKATKDAIKAGMFKSRPLVEWSFVNSFLFCGNVVTTIGYGHIAPKTLAGRLVCIIYALFGIPLTGYFLRTVGNELTNLLAYLIKYWERRLYNREAEKIEMKSAITASLLALVMLFLGGAIFTSSETWNYADAFYFCFITLTTIGFGDLVPGLNKESNEEGISLILELCVLIYYVIGLSVMSGVILSISNLIEEKTKKFDVADPMDAIRNLRIENLNTKAMKKLGYKVTNGPLDEMTHYNLNTRRGTIVPEDTVPRRVSKLFDEAQRNRLSALHSNSTSIPPMLPNGTITRKVKPRDDMDEEEEVEGKPATDKDGVSKEEKSDKAATVDEASTKIDMNGLTVSNSLVVDVDVSPAPSRRPSSSTRPLSATSLSKLKKNRIKPSNNPDPPNSDSNNGVKHGGKKEPPDGPPPLTSRKSKTKIKRSNEIGLPSELFAASIHSNRTEKSRERSSSESHTDEIEFNEIMEEFLGDQLSSNGSNSRTGKGDSGRSPTPEFLSLTKDHSGVPERNGHRTATGYDDPPGSQC